MSSIKFHPLVLCRIFSAFRDRTKTQDPRYSTVFQKVNTRTHFSRFALGVTTLSLCTFSPTKDKIQILKTTLPTEISLHPLASRLKTALHMGREAGQAILSVKKTRNLQTQIKEDHTPVTLADQASNRILCQTIHRLYPRDGILSEETIKGEKSFNDAITKGVDADYAWVLDPLDGTKAFLVSTGLKSSDLDPRYQGKHYGIHIGLLQQGKPILGVNYYPEIDTLYFALDGFAYKQTANEPAERVFVPKLVFGIHPILNPNERERGVVGKIYQKLLGEEKAQRFATQGLFLDSFGDKMARIAEGNACNLYIAPACGPGFWDVCSMIPFIKAVGGIVTDWDGNPIDFRNRSHAGLLPKGVIITINPDLHKRVITIIKELTQDKQLPPYGFTK